MDSRLSAWTSAIEQLDTALTPVATRPVALTELASAEARQHMTDPLAEAGVREAAAALIAEILDAYPRACAGDRERMRALFASHRRFAWAAGFLLPFSPEPSTVRQQLLLFSLLDQGTDSRDALLWLTAFCGQPGVDCAALPELLREVAALSSAVDRFHIGSTASMLVAAAANISTPRPFPPPSGRPMPPAASPRR